MDAFQNKQLEEKLYEEAEHQTSLIWGRKASKYLWKGLRISIKSIYSCFYLQLERDDLINLELS